MVVNTWILSALVGSIKTRGPLTCIILNIKKSAYLTINNLLQTAHGAGH